MNLGSYKRWSWDSRFCSHYDWLNSEKSAQRSREPSVCEIVSVLDSWRAVILAHEVLERLGTWKSNTGWASDALRRIILKFSDIYTLFKVTANQFTQRQTILPWVITTRTWFGLLNIVDTLFLKRHRSKSSRILIWVVEDRPSTFTFTYYRVLHSTTKRWFLKHNTAHKHHTIAHTNEQNSTSKPNTSLHYKLLSHTFLPHRTKHIIMVQSAHNLTASLSVDNRIHHPIQRHTTVNLQIP